MPNSMQGDTPLSPQHGGCGPDIGPGKALRPAWKKEFPQSLLNVKGHHSSRNTSTPVFKPIRLMDQLQEQIRWLHYSRADSTPERLPHRRAATNRAGQGSYHGRSAAKADTHALRTWLTITPRNSNLHAMPKGSENVHNRTGVVRGENRI